MKNYYHFLICFALDFVIMVASVSGDLKPIMLNCFVAKISLLDLNSINWHIPEVFSHYYPTCGAYEKDISLYTPRTHGLYPPWDSLRNTGR